MKMNYLKKFGAVALAAVMAVTFAPVASLNVFAAVDPDKGTFGDNDTLTNAAITWKATTDGTVTVGTVAKAGKTITIDMNGCNLKLECNDGAAKIAVKNSKSVNKFGSTIPTLTLDITTGKSISLSGNYKLSVTTDQGISAYAAPAAKVDNDIYVGNVAINAGNEKTSGHNIKALHGAVEIDTLADGKYAAVDDAADEGTTIKVSKADGTDTLQTLTTTYDFYYVSAKDYKAGDMGSKVSGHATYTDTRYYAGNTGAFLGTANAALRSDGLDKLNKTNEEALVVTTGAILAPKGVGYKKIAKLTKGELTVLTTNQNINTPLLATTAVDYKMGEDITKASSYTIPDTAKGVYYVFNPGKYVDSDSAFALIDGSKYRVTDENADILDGVEPTKSFKLLQTKEYTKEDGNKNAVVEITYRHPEITLDAAEDLSVATKIEKHVTGNTTSYNAKALFFGTEKFGDNSVKNAMTGSIGDSDSLSTVALNVAKVAKGATSTFTFDKVTDKSSADRASGIGYYRKSTSDGTYDYTFGTTDVITKEFVDAAQGTVTDGIQANPDFRDGNIFASKEIKTTVKGVNADVTFHGEISAEAVATDAKTGKKTWEINLADTATNDKAVVAYRLYDGNRGEHIYTYNPVERDMLVKSGWKEETSDIKVLPVDAKTGVTVYRVYNPNNGGAHVYTTNPEEVKMLLAAGWEEGVAVFKTPAAGTANTLPVYRVYNTGSKNGEHQFTTSAAEKDNLVNHGWKLEGTPWYSFK